MRKMTERQFIRAALAEDIGSGDITTIALGLKTIKGEAEVIAKEAGIISGIIPFKQVFNELSRSVSVKIHKKDGQRVKRGARVISLKGPLEILLMGERTAMNIISHLSGIATLTGKFKNKIGGKKTKILDTRKTMPGMRIWEKRAVVHGGGYNHRIGLYDMYLIKANHIAAAGGIGPAMTAAKRHRKKTKAKIEIEVRNLAELREALSYSPDYILLDNFTLPLLKQAVRISESIDRRVILEASGNVDLKTIGKIAASGVHRISIGKLTHSAPALDLSFRVRSV